MSSTKPFTVKHFADCKPSSSSSLRSLAHCHQPSAASSTETVVYYPQPQKENVRAPSKSASRFINTNAPGGPRTVTVQSGIPLLLGFPTTDLCVTEFDTSITQKPHWSLPDHITQVLDHQKKRHGEPKPKEANFELQAKNRNRVFDPEHGKIYTHCNECDPNGGARFLFSILLIPNTMLQDQQTANTQKILPATALDSIPSAQTTPVSPISTILCRRRLPPKPRPRATSSSRRPRPAKQPLPRRATFA